MEVWNEKTGSMKSVSLSGDVAKQDSKQYFDRYGRWKFTEVERLEKRADALMPGWHTLIQGAIYKIDRVTLVGASSYERVKLTLAKGKVMILKKHEKITILT